MAASPSTQNGRGKLQGDEKLARIPVIGAINASGPKKTEMVEPDGRDKRARLLAELLPLLDAGLDPAHLPGVPYELTDAEAAALKEREQSASLDKEERRALGLHYTMEEADYFYKMLMSAGADLKMHDTGLAGELFITGQDYIMRSNPPSIRRVGFLLILEAILQTPEILFASVEHMRARLGSRGATKLE